jgi:hypothetical protein
VPTNTAYVVLEMPVSMGPSAYRLMLFWSSILVRQICQERVLIFSLVMLTLTAMGLVELDDVAEDDREIVSQIVASQIAKGRTRRSGCSKCFIAGIAGR